MKKALIIISAFVLALTLQTRVAAAAPTIDATLVKQVNSSPLALTQVVITYDHQPSSADFAALKSLGIKGGVYLDQLPMVLTAINKAQLNALSTRSDIRSLYANHKFDLLDDKSRPFIGVTALRADRETTTANGGMPVSGKNVGVAYVDTGIDATHPDLQLGKNVAGNVLFPLAEYAATEMPVESEFIPVLAVEDQPLSDVQGGHGTFGAGVTAGTGQASGTFYGGVAPGAKLVGLVAGNDVGLTTFAIVQAFNYTLANQFRYNIRVCNNSWGTTLSVYPYDTNDPINVATLSLHDHNITVLVAAGNGIGSVGDRPGAINPFSVAPWVISVAAADKEGLGNPAGFSSRGENNGTGSDVAGAPETREELPPPNLRPDITGSGVNIKSVRSKGPGLTNLAGLPPYLNNDLNTIGPALLPYYTTSQGTSFSTPQLSGVVALMMEANPLLTPDEVVSLLRQTATPMPYPERVVGAGYVDARNAVRAAMGLTAVNHPATLFRQPGDPQIIDPPNDNSGNASQDIRTARFQYQVDPVQGGQIVYTLTVGDLSTHQAENQWTLSSNFAVAQVTTTIFVSASVDELGTVIYGAGKIAPDPNTGVSTQTRISNSGVTGQLQGNQIIIRFPINAVNKAIFGTDATGNANGSVVGLTSTGTDVKAQQLFGSSLTGGLLLAADTAGGADFVVGS